MHALLLWPLSIAAVFVAIRLVFRYVLHPPVLVAPPLPQLVTSAFRVDQLPPFVQPKDKNRALVVGSSGNLGMHLLAALLDAGELGELIGVDVRALPADYVEWLQQKARTSSCTLRFETCDIGQPAAEAKLAQLMAANGPTPPVSVVFHTASLIQYAPNFHPVWRVNVAGTARVINACLQAGVRRLVYTSSIAAVFDGHRNLVRAHEGSAELQKLLDEWPSSPSLYNFTKATAERLVAAANSPALATCMLRPPGMYGFRDPLMVHPCVTGQMLPPDDIRTELISAENAADAHLAAAAALLPAPGTTGPAGPAAGKAYFVTDGQIVRPELTWAKLRVLYDAKLPRRVLEPWQFEASIRVAQAVNWLTAHYFSHRHMLFQLTPAMHSFLQRSYSFDCSAAQRDLRWTPRCNTDQSLERIVARYREFEAAAAAAAAAARRTGREIA